MDKKNGNSLVDPKLIYLILGIFFFSLTLIYLFIQNKKNPTLNNPSKNLLPTPQNKTKALENSTGGLSPTSFERFKEIEVAPKIFFWFDSQKDKNGAYFFNQIVKPGGEIVNPKSSDNRVATNVIWAKLAFWQKSQDLKILKSMEEDIDNHLDKNKIITFQPNFWSCKTLFDIKESAQVPEEIKEKAKKLCKRSLVLIEEISPLFLNEENTNINKVAEIDYANIFNQPVMVTFNPFDEVNLKNRFDKFAALASDFAIRYLWFGNINSLTIAKNLFNLAGNIYQEQFKAGVSRNECLLGTASLDLYKATKENKYYLFAKNIYANDILKGDRNLFRKTICLYYVYELKKLENNQKYDLFLERLIGDLFEKNYDRESGLFYDINGDNKVRGVKENSILVKMLLSM